MKLSKSEILTIKRAFIIYRRKLPNALRGKGFFIDASTFKEDIMNMVSIEKKFKIY